jgi:hypothetical protein
MNSTSPLMPSDVAEYLKRAAIDLATEEGFKPSSERSLMVWMESNHVAICERARENMRSLVDKLLAKPAMMDEACRILSLRIYRSIPKNAEKQWNPRFVRYATSRGMKPDEVLAADGNMTGYLCWKGK